jgi:hypothetical protein
MAYCSLKWAKSSNTKSVLKYRAGYLMLLIHYYTQSEKQNSFMVPFCTILKSNHCEYLKEFLLFLKLKLLGYNCGWSNKLLASFPPGSNLALSFSLSIFFGLYVFVFQDTVSIYCSEWSQVILLPQPSGFEITGVHHPVQLSFVFWNIFRSI